MTAATGDVAAVVKWTMREKGSGRKKSEPGFGRDTNMGASRTFSYSLVFSQISKLLLNICLP